MSARNFGLVKSRRPVLGDNTRGDAPIARGAAREPIWLAGLEADLIGEVAPDSPRVAATKFAKPGRVLSGARNEDASIQLAGKTSRPANSRGASSELLIAMERATKWFLIFAAFLIGAAFAALLFVVSLVIDYGWSDSPF